MILEIPFGGILLFRRFTSTIGRDEERQRKRKERQKQRQEHMHKINERDCRTYSKFRTRDTRWKLGIKRERKVDRGIKRARERERERERERKGERNKDWDKNTK